MDAHGLLSIEQGLGYPPVGEARGQKFEHLAPAGFGAAFGRFTTNGVEFCSLYERRDRLVMIEEYESE